LEFDQLEFYATVDLNAIDLHDQLASWQHANNWDRPHSLNGKTPIDRVCELIERTRWAKKSTSCSIPTRSGSATLSTPLTGALKVERSL
jgi:hypothetical protein